jgi:hypothetical protein
MDIGTSEKEDDNNNNDNYDQNTDWKIVTIICSALIVIILIINLGLAQLVQPNTYSLTFNDDLTYNDGSVTLLVDNNNKSSIKKILIYGSNNNTELKISSSHLMDESHLAIKSAKITFNGKPSILLKELKNELKVIDVSIDKIPPGEYTGRIIIAGNDTTSVPIKVTTEPMLVSALLWVLLGILISVISWELINYLTTKNYDEMKDDVKKDEKLSVESKKRLIEVIKSRKHRHTMKHNSRWSGSGWQKQVIYIIGAAGFAMSVGIIYLPMIMLLASEL